jgi:hypothetical protein
VRPFREYGIHPKFYAQHRYWTFGRNLSHDTTFTVFFLQRAGKSLKVGLMLGRRDYFKK